MKKNLILILCICLTAGCAWGKREQIPDLGAIYNRSASHIDLERNPIIVIPGILGSRLVETKTNQVVWGAFGGNAVNPKIPADARLFAHPMAFQTPLANLRDSIRSDGALDRIDVNFLFLPIRLGAYYHILKSLGVGGYRDQQLGEAGAIDYGDGHFTCFQFDYDWRRDISENAVLLHEFIEEKKKYVQDEKQKRFGVRPGDVKFDIVAHSMGGLVARYYLRYGNQPLLPEGELPELNWSGAKQVERAVLIGTPNAGSVHALEQLVEGIQFSKILPKYEPAILGTMPSIYQLLPRARHQFLFELSNQKDGLDPLDFDLWVDHQWGLADPDQDEILEKLLPKVQSADERRVIALDHLRKSLLQARRFQKVLDIPSKPPRELSLSLISGDAAQTAAVLGIDPEHHTLKVIHKAAGDGTVLRSSALMDERLGRAWMPRLDSPIYWNHVVFLFKDHLGITMDPAFIDNLLFYLLESPRNL